MKVSVKVREEQRPLVRAKLPLNVLGLPLFTGVTSGDAQDLALHMGTDVQAGPSFRLSYKPSNVASPFSVLMKTGFGLWGSPNRTPMALSAEFNFQHSGSPSFCIRLKPTMGDFGLRKDSGKFQASFDAFDRRSSAEGAFVAGGGADGVKALEGTPSLNGKPVGAIKGQGSGSSGSSASANGDLVHRKGGLAIERVESLDNGSLEKSDSFGKPKGATADHAEPTVDGDSHEADQGPGVEDSFAGGAVAATVRKSSSWFRSSADGWRFHAHSSLGLGKVAVAKVRWQMKFNSDLFQDVRSGLRISDVKLPALTVDKLSFETLSPRRYLSSGADFAAFGIGDEENSQLGMIASMCSSMRYQLHLLHLENKALKSSLDDWRGDAGARRPGPKGTDLLMQEETALRSQLFDELNGKLNGGSVSKNGRYSKDSFSLGDVNGKTKGSAGEDFQTRGDPAEELQKAIKQATGSG